MSMLCSECFRGTLRGDVQPTGTEETIFGRQTYVARPEPGVEPIGVVVIVADAFGWTLRNTRALADTYARRVPCIVYVPDFMNGYNLPEWSLSKFEAKPPPNLLGAAWHYLSYLLLAARLLPGLYLHNRPAAALPRIRDWLYALRTERGASAKIGVAGFCWGGHFSIMLTHPDAGNYAGVAVPEGSLPEGQAKGQMRSLAHVIDCSFTAHPALVEVPGHIEAAVQPLSVANGDDDEWMGRKDMQKLVETIEAKNRRVSEGEQKFEAVVYPGAPHGFAVRGNRDDPLQKERGDQSEDQAVRWFQKWFRSKG